MEYYYLAFGITIISEIELPALLPVQNQSLKEAPVYVKLGLVPAGLFAEGSPADSNAYCNANEMLYIIPDKIKFYIANGREIIIEPVSPNYLANLIYFYSNCLAAILYQRDLIPFHVSGVFTQKGKVALFAAPSGAGKSTLALKLQELGYKAFTDDTAVLYIENGKCYARASYPMMRLWQNTLKEQALLKEDAKQQLYEDEEFDKYGFSFHQKFITEPAEVERIIFLQQAGDEIQVKPMSLLEAFTELSNNVYRCHWIPAMQKNRLQFTLISRIIKIVPNIKCVRPQGKDSFNEFSWAIKDFLEITGI